MRILIFSSPSTSSNSFIPKAIVYTARLHLSTTARTRIHLNHPRTSPSLHKSIAVMPADSNEVSEFISLLYQLVNDPAAGDVIEWTKSGDEIVVKDEFKFTANLLQRYFRASTFASFVRQLNLYGFSKRGDRFFHTNFHRDRPDELKFIKRKPQSSSTAATSSKKTSHKHPSRTAATAEKKPTRSLKVGTRRSTRQQFQGEDDEEEDDDAYNDQYSQAEEHYPAVNQQEQEYYPPIAQPTLYPNEFDPHVEDDNAFYPSQYPPLPTTAIPVVTNAIQPTSDRQLPINPHQSSLFAGNKYDERDVFNPSHHIGTSSTPPSLPLYSSDQSIPPLNHIHDTAFPPSTPKLNSDPPNFNNTSTDESTQIVPLVFDNFNPSASFQRHHTRQIPRTGAQTAVPVEHFNAVVSELEDQVDILTQQYSALYHTQHHILYLLSRYFGSDMNNPIEMPNIFANDDSQALKGLSDMNPSQFAQNQPQNAPGGGAVGIAPTSTTTNQTNQTNQTNPLSGLNKPTTTQQPQPESELPVIPLSGIHISVETPNNTPHIHQGSTASQSSQSNIIHPGLATPPTFFSPSLDSNSPPYQPIQPHQANEAQKKPK